jgi:hypothetical protein
VSKGADGESGGRREGGGQTTVVGGGRAGGGANGKRHSSASAGGQRLDSIGLVAARRRGRVAVPVSRPKWPVQSGSRVAGGAGGRCGWAGGAAACEKWRVTV